MSDTTKPVDLKGIGEINFKLKDIYKTIAFIVGLVSLALIYKDEIKSNNSQLNTTISAKFEEVNTRILKNDNEDKIRDIKIGVISDNVNRVEYQMAPLLRH